MHYRTPSELTLTEKIIAVNGRLTEWKQFNDTVRVNSRSTKSAENLARAIVAQLTHVEAVNCVAADWHKFSTDVRQWLTRLCNKEREQPSSNNKAKTIKALDDRLGGKVLRTVDDDRMRDASGRRYHEAAAAAQRKYATR